MNNCSWKTILSSWDLASFQWLMLLVVLGRSIPPHDLEHPRDFCGICDPKVCSNVVRNVASQKLPKRENNPPAFSSRTCRICEFCRSVRVKKLSLISLVYHFRNLELGEMIQFTQGGEKKQYGFAELLHSLLGQKNI